jgi:uncharacterized phage protein (TIGR02220 family)
MLSLEVSHGPEGGYTLITILNYERYQGSEEEAEEHGLSHDLSHGRDTLGTRLEPYTRIKELEKEILSPSNDRGAVSEIISYLNERVGGEFKPTTKATCQHIRARLREGFSVADFKAVIDCKVADWYDDAKMFRYLRPQTLFSTKFEAYLNEAKQTEEDLDPPIGPAWEKGKSETARDSQEGSR